LLLAPKLVDMLAGARQPYVAFLESCAMALSRRELERLSYRSEDQLSPEAVGALLTLLYIARQNQPLPGRRELSALFQGQADIPARLKRTVELIDRFDGPVLATYTEMVDFAQQAGVLRRFNPGHVNSAPELEPVAAQHVLAMVASDYGEEVRWLDKILSSGGSERVRNELVPA
jgi:hypothetical protein